MWDRLGEVWRSITDPIEKFADYVAPNSKPPLPSPEGVAAIPDTTSKEAIEKATQSGILPYINTWIYGEAEPTQKNKIEGLSLEPKLPTPSPFDREQQLKLLDTLLKGSSTEEKVLEQIKNDSDAHKALIRLFMDQMTNRELHAKIRTLDLRRYRDQMKIVHVTKKMIEEEIAYAKSRGSALQTTQKVCTVVALSALALTVVVFVSTATAGTGTVPILSVVAQNAAYFGMAAKVGTAVSGVGRAATHIAKAHLKEREDHADSSMIATQHESDIIDEEMKVLQQWMAQVMRHLSTLTEGMVEAEEQRHYTIKKR